MNYLYALNGPDGDGGVFHIDSTSGLKRLLCDHRGPESVDRRQESAAAPSRAAYMTLEAGLVSPSADSEGAAA